MTGRKPLNVLVVDDSAVVRQLLSAILSQQGMTVTVAADPLFAIRKMEQSRPDVVILDIEMPRMDGLTFLRKIMREAPLPVVICSSHASRGTETAMKALEEGAVDILPKPRVGLKEYLEESATFLGDAVRAAAEARVGRSRPKPPEPRLTTDAVLPAAPSRSLRSNFFPVVAVGASTGGTEALRRLLEPLPANAPPLVIVQHMPEGFTAAFAKRLDSLCRITVKEAEDGDAVTAGRALIAPGNRHLLLTRCPGGYRVEVRDGPLVSRHRPSIDVLFRSVAQTAGPAGVGMLLTGMGADGAAGLLEMKKAGAATYAQNEETCVVFGMPKEAIALGAVDEVLPLQDLPKAILGGRRS